MKKAFCDKQAAINTPGLIKKAVGRYVNEDHNPNLVREAKFPIFPRFSQTMGDFNDWSATTCAHLEIPASLLDENSTMCVSPRIYPEDHLYHIQVDSACLTNAYNMEDKRTLQLRLSLNGRCSRHRLVSMRESVTNDRLADAYEEIANELEELKS